MHGFTGIEIDQSTGGFKAAKIAFVKGGTSLKNRKKQNNDVKQNEVKASAAPSNPWESLVDQDDGSDEINEDDLMKDQNKVDNMTAKFTGDADRIMPGKPCDNCTCGKKEL